MPEVSGTWTNATHIACAVYRGALAPVGTSSDGFKSIDGTSATLSYAALAPTTRPPATAGAWYAAFAAHKTATNVGTAPTGMTNRATSGSTAVHDTNGIVASNWALQTAAVNASGYWQSYVVQVAASGTVSRVGANVADATSVAIPSGYAVGDLILICAMCDTSGISPTTPAGYTALETGSSAFGGATLAYRIAASSDVAAPTFLPQIILFPPTAAAPVGTTWEQARSYADLANRPPVTGTTRPFASLAALTGALNAAVPGDLVSYTGAGILDIPGNYTGFAGRRYAGYVNVDLGLAASANHVRFPGGGGAGLPAVGIYNSSYLRIYGGEITNPPPKTVGHDGLHIYGAGHPGDGATHHITWWNLVVHDTVDSGIKLLPNVPFPGGTQSAADNTISDCDIEATVYMIGRDKTVDTHPEQGTGQHCCLLADTDPAGATYPSFLRNRVAIDGYNTGLSSSQGGGSVCELGFNDAPSTISGCTLILRGNNTLFNAQQQTAGNCLNLWGDATIGCAVPFIQHSNATGSAVSNYPPGTNRSGVVVSYGRHTSTNRNAYEGTNPWQIGPTYLNVA